MIKGSFCMLVPVGYEIDLEMIRSMVGDDSPMRLLGTEYPGKITSTSVIHYESVQRGILVEFDLDYFSTNDHNAHPEG